MHTDQPKISIVVCTRNRARRLALCLASLESQTALPDSFEVIVVDNLSTDSTAECVTAFVQRNANFRYVIETHVGVSYARNRGYQEAAGEYVAYLDDDGRAFPDFVERILSVAHRRAFSYWGGMVVNEYEAPRPAWLSEKFRSNVHLFAQHKDIVPIRHHETIWGAVMVAERKVLEIMNGFNTEYGMRSDKRRYGEESELQDRLQAAGYKVGIDPQLRIHHLVNPQAYNLMWHWRDSYGAGYDSAVHWEQQSILLVLLRSRLSHCRIIGRGFLSLVWNKDYYWQNFLIDVLGPLIRDYGILHRWMKPSIINFGKRSGG